MSRHDPEADEAAARLAEAEAKLEQQIDHNNEVEGRLQAAENALKALREEAASRREEQDTALREARDETERVRGEQESLLKAARAEAATLRSEHIRELAW